MFLFKAKTSFHESSLEHGHVKSWVSITERGEISKGGPEPAAARREDALCLGY